MNELALVYQQIAMERPHICSGCGTIQRLSHSHLVPRSRRPDLKTVKDNIVYDCLSLGEIVGCHSRWDSKEFWKLRDVEARMKYVYSVDPSYFHLKINNAMDAYNKRLKGLCVPPARSKDFIHPEYVEAAKAVKRLEFLLKIAA